MGASLSRRGEGGKEEHLPLGWVVEVSSFLFKTVMVICVSLVRGVNEKLALLSLSLGICREVEFNKGLPSDELQWGGLGMVAGRGRAGMFCWSLLIRSAVVRRPV